MENNFSNIMADRSDAELLNILTNQRDDYQPEAIQAAEIEYKKRNLSEDQINIAQKEIEIVNEQVLEKANQKLETIWKAIAFIFPGILLLIFSGTFKADGYDKKAKELIKWTLYGFGFYLGLFILIMILNNLG
jgi:hypothetical protein